ncbi:DUF1016 N-terminal domain-containing protein [Verminephrobacter aporrectodeae]|uniref:DUF1016 N-terminal domain-containing protein n=1 Tax=Verminephrobacter aporrectodeae TaxID=1110389 RepID=UPI002237DF69|nr:DUF1016 N-terminal domain-containing protein [Verminephrobacter aporrectodeae]
MRIALNHRWDMPAPKTDPKAGIGKPALYGRVREILAAARTGIARTVNTTQVMANWLIGREIVEEEQRGRRRAGYGTALLGELAERLRTDFGAGYGVDNLELFRRFYREYPQLLAEAVPERISDAPRRKSSAHAAAADLNAGSACKWLKTAGLSNVFLDDYLCLRCTGDQSLRVRWGHMRLLCVHTRRRGAFERICFSTTRTVLPRWHPLTLASP